MRKRTILPLTLAALLVPAVPALAQTAPQNAPSTMAPQTDTGARPGNDIGTRSSLPLTTKASNINGSDTNSTIAPTPPLPNVPPGANVQALLEAAQQSIAKGQTGTAQEALEQAETQLLQRSVLASVGAQPSADPVVTQISQARQALGNHDNAGATQIIGEILTSNAPELTE